MSVEKHVFKWPILEFEAPVVPSEGVVKKERKVRANLSDSSYCFDVEGFYPDREDIYHNVQILAVILIYKKLEEKKL